MTALSSTPHLEQLIDLAIEEDLGNGDLTSDSLFDAQHRSEARVEARQDLVLCGTAVAAAVFRRLDPDLEFHRECEDGETLTKGSAVIRLSGSTRAILRGERTALNFLQHLSGIATLTAAYVQRARSANPAVRVVDTRKTLPGYRALAKFAVRCGGGHNHRFNLGDAAMLKDNHIAAAGSIAEAVARLRDGIPHTARIVVEADTLAQVEAAREAGADIVLLDNMTIEQLREAVKLAGRALLLEASGGVTLETIGDIAATGVHVISVGALTHSAPAVDLSMNFQV